jgi:hypothetical protein
MAGNTTGPAPIYGPEHYDLVLEQIAAGTPLATICEADGMPSLSTFYAWRDENPENAARYARARKAGCAIVEREIITISDLPLIGSEEKLELLGVMKRPGDDSGPPVVLPGAELVVTEVKRGDNVARAKLMTENRWRLLRCWDPATYGDKVSVDNKHSGAVGFAVNINDQPKPKAGG